MSFDPEFPGLLADISKIYTGEKLFWLRLLLYGHCAGDLLSKPKITGHDLFNQLKARGYISYEPKDASCTDVEMLVDIAEVTEEKRALQIIQKFKQKHKNKNSNYNFRKGKPISEYRKNLFKALHSNTTDLLSEMPGHYGLNPADFNNKWDLVFKLEGSKALEESNIEKMEHFAMILDEDAKQIFLQTQNGARKKSTRTKGKASASKGTRKRQRSTTSEEADNVDNSATRDTAPSTSKQKRTRVSGSSTRKASKNKKKQIMISYNHTHDVTVKYIYNELKEKLKKSHEIWIDFNEITGDLAEDIEKGIKESSIVLICLSEDYEKSKNCKFECKKIQEHKKPSIQLKMEKYEPERNSKVQQLVRGKSKLYIDFTDEMNFKDNIKKLIRCIKKEQK